MQNLRLITRTILIFIVFILIYIIYSLYSQSFNINTELFAINGPIGHNLLFNSEKISKDETKSSNEQVKANINHKILGSQNIESNNNDQIKSDLQPDKLLDNNENSENKQNFISDEKLASLRKSWDAQLEIVRPIQTGYPCQMSSLCPKNTHFPFRVRSGAASVIGPWICVNGVDIMRSVLNNVDRGMNIAVIDGRTGLEVNQGIFDLYAKDSTDLIKFLNTQVLARENALIFATSYDDAAMRLSEDARNLLRKLQFEDVDKLQFRDNFVFVGGVHSKSFFQKVVKHDLNNDKYGDWPESIEVEGCIERL